MASIWRRAMVYLGLQDDEEFAHDADYDYPEGDLEPAAHDPRDARELREPRDRRELRDPRDTEPPRDPRELRDPRDHVRAEHGVTVRPVARDDAADISPQRSSVVRAMPATSVRVHEVDPQGFNDAQEVGDRLKANQPVILNLQGVSRELQRRLIDFSSGLAYAVGGSMERTAEQAFLLTPSNTELSQEEKERLQARGLYRA
ncbi:MAG: cell division protein SepF [Acidimicrobiia bacterium]